MNATSLSIARIQDCPRLSTAALKDVLQRFNGKVPTNFYARPPEFYMRDFGFSKRTAEAISAYTPRDPSAYEALNIQMLTFLDNDYPTRFRMLRTPPPVLSTFGLGQKELIKGSFCVICSKGWELDNPVPLKDAIEAGIQAGFICVAGHNRPVYQWALLAAKRTAKSALMVLDRGILTAFDSDMVRDPVAAARIWGYSFDSQHCGVISPFRLRDGWAPSNSLKRDRLVGCLADTIIVMGMKPQGRIHTVCLEALSRGQTVLADVDAHSILAQHGTRLWEGEIPSATSPGEHV